MSKILSYLEALDISPQMERFGERKRLQKLAYLLKMWGLDVPFEFSWYLHGPYSPGTTRLLYEIAEKRNVAAEKLRADEIRKIAEFKGFLGEDLKDSDKLELLASVHYLRKQAREVGAPDNDALLVLKAKKPYFSDQEIQECWKKSLQLDKLIRS